MYRNVPKCTEMYQLEVTVAENGLEPIYTKTIDVIALFDCVSSTKKTSFRSLIHIYSRVGSLWSLGGPINARLVLCGWVEPGGG